MTPAVAMLLMMFAEAPDSETNLAKGRPYSLNPLPNYSLTTDLGDTTQLTDGRHAGGGFWTSAGAVGWSGVKPVSITVDLGTVSAITGAGFSTAAGRAGVQWPTTILLFGSGDGVTFSYLGDLVALDNLRGGSPPSTEFARYTFQTHALSGRFRYMRLVVDTPGPYVFSDEVEIYGSRMASETVVLGSITDTTAFFLRARAAFRLTAAVTRILHEARSRLRFAQLPRADEVSLSSDLATLERRVSQLSLEDWDAAATQYPLNELQYMALAVIGRIEALSGMPPLRAWAANPWDPLTLTTVPTPNQWSRIETHLMNGEVRSTALNIRNSSDARFEVALDMSDIEAVEAGWLQVRSVAWTTDTDANPVAAALLPVSVSNGRYIISAPPGVTSQVWLTFAPTHLPPGLHHCTVRISAAGAQSVSIPVDIGVLPTKFPTKLRLHISGWDYLNDHGRTQGGPEYLLRIAELLRSYGVNVPWGTASVMPFGRYDAHGNMTEKPATAGFDGWIARWPRAARYRVFIAAGDHLEGLRYGTPAFEAAVKAWSLFWAKHIREKGINTANMDLLFVDEPRETSQAERQIAWAHAAKASGTGLRVWVNPIYPSPSQIPQSLIDSADSVSINRDIAQHSRGAYWVFARRQRVTRKNIEMYGTDGPSYRLDPYSYYRLMAWRAFDIGGSAVSFWSFTDTGGGSSWKPYLAPHTVYSPLFLDGSSALPGKDLEAIREGAEDFEYLAMLQDEISRAASHRPRDPIVDEAHSVLTTLTSRVLAAASQPQDIEWTSPKDRSVADSARAQLAEMLARISSL